MEIYHFPEPNIAIVTDVEYYISSFLRQIRKLHNREVSGGCLCIADKNGIPLLLRGYGSIDFTKIERCYTLAQEKAARLGDHPEHQSSAQSQNTAEEKYPGAIRADDYILSFSGLPAALDQALMLAVAIRTKLLTTEEAAKIALLYGSEEYQQLLDMLK